MSAELLPCPFCNGAASLARCGFGTGRVVCLVCGAEGKYCQDHNSAISAWNARDQAKEAELVRMRDLADSEGSRAVKYLRRARKAEAEIAALKEAETRLSHWCTEVRQDREMLASVLRALLNDPANSEAAALAKAALGEASNG